MDSGRIVAEGSPARADRAVLDPRGRRAALPAGRGDGRAARCRAQLVDRGSRRADRGAARPRAPLHRRRRRRRRPPCTERRPRRRCRCSCAAARSRTSSCASPAGRWWTDGDAADARRRRLPSFAHWTVPSYRGLWRGSAGQQRARSRCCSSPRWASALGALVDARRRRRSTASATWSSSRPAAGRDAPMQIAARRVDVAGARRRSSGTGPTTRMLATPLGVARRPRRPPALRRACAVIARRRCSSSSWRCSARSQPAGACSRCPAALLTGLAFAAPDRRVLGRRGRDRQRVRRAPAVRRSCRCSCSPARSSRSPSCPTAAAGRLRHAAVARRRAVPRAARSGTVEPRRRARCTSPTCSSWIAVGVRRSAAAQLPAAAGRHDGDRTLAAPTSLPLRCPPTPLSARPRAAARRAQHRSSYRRSWVHVRLRLLRAALLPAVDRHRHRRASSATCAGSGAAADRYTQFVAPALLAASAMNGAIYDTTFNFFFKLKYAKLYDAMLATPLAPATSRSARSPGRCCAARSTRPRSSS